MTVLERLRKRSGLLVTIVGVALFSFVLTGLFESRFSLFQDRPFAGEIAGTEISLEQYDLEVDKMTQQQLDNTGQTSLDAQAQEMVSGNAWEKLIRDLTLGKEIDASGIQVSDNELSDMIIGKNPDQSVKSAFMDPQTQKVNPQFADAAGNLNGAKIKEYVDKLQESPEGAEYYEKWKKFEESLREQRKNTKYFNAIKKGLYVTTSYAKQEYLAQNTMVKFRYILKRYSVVSDTTIKVTEDEMQRYYNENKYKYKQEASRKVEYLVWDILPSGEDSTDALDKLKAIADEFKTTKEDSALVVRESETPYFDANLMKRNQISGAMDTSIFTAPVGTVIGPYYEGIKVKVSKLIKSATSVDSASVRHILIPYVGAQQAPAGAKQTKEQAKATADSLLKILKKSTANFADYVVKFSSDSGSVREMKEGKMVLKEKKKLGAYEWFKEGQMMKEFQDAAFFGKKGDVVIAETPYGFHIVEVLAVGGSSPRYQIATIERTIEPSTKTKQGIYDLASDFAIKYNTADLFNKGVEEQKLNKRVIETLKQSDKQIPGIEQPKDLIRWAYTNEKGTVCVEPFTLGNKYVVALLTDVREKGIAPLEQRKIEVEIGAKQDKKAAMFMEEFTKAGATAIDALGTKLNLPVELIDNINFSAFSVPNLGRELNVLGNVFALKENQISKPIKGTQGVFVVVVDKTTPAADTKDYTASKKQLQQKLQYSVDTDLFQAMKEIANVVDNRVKYY
jgi:peptidyl-prolyl cis-trans isomerase D